MASKLHLYSTSGGPFCGRMLSNHRAQRAQDALEATVTLDHAAFAAQLTLGKACRWCGQKAGLVAAVPRSSWREQLDEEENES